MREGREVRTTPLFPADDGLATSVAICSWWDAFCWSTKETGAPEMP